MDKGLGPGRKAVNGWPWAAAERAPGPRHPATQHHLLGPRQALKDVKALGCRKAMRKFERRTLLVSGASRNAPRGSGMELAPLPPRSPSPRAGAQNSSWGGDPAGVQAEGQVQPGWALTGAGGIPQEYLRGEGNLSRPAVQLLGDVMSEDGFFYLSFEEALRAHSCLSDQLR